MLEIKYNERKQGVFHGSILGHFYKNVHRTKELNILQCSQGKQQRNPLRVIFVMAVAVLVVACRMHGEVGICARSSGR